MFHAVSWLMYADVTGPFPHMGLSAFLKIQFPYYCHNLLRHQSQQQAWIQKRR
ncbi:hypothetical protein C2845_PM15G01270 [Panicum miliaceum]|uniref:Uncharacterized protein n=1 Tax=Panicum miliaceum TaxID=4540 RepID=A0A3L6Q6X5_PANMI|nr:hypothetical protein C2845_PM15G01270 [Panicum miliaceum]